MTMTSPTSPASEASSTKHLVYIALFAAFTAALGLMPAIYIPFTTVPIIGQNMGCMLAGGILGAKRGMLSQLLFVVLVAIGLPLLTGGRGGVAPLVGPWSGYIYSWILAGFVIGWLIERQWDKLDQPGSGHLRIAFSLVLGGLVLVYAIGASWMIILFEAPVKETLISLLFFLPGAAVKVTLSTLIIFAVKRSYPLIQVR